MMKLIPHTGIVYLFVWAIPMHMFIHVMKYSLVSIALTTVHFFILHSSTIPLRSSKNLAIDVATFLTDTEVQANAIFLIPFKE